MKTFRKTSQKTEGLSLYLKAENMKYRHTSLGALMILMPAVCTLLSAMLTYNYFAMDGYNWWYMSMLPGVLAIICGQIGGKDLKKKNRTIWALPADMGKIWDAKILLSAMVVGIATFALMIFVLLGTEIMEKGLFVTFTNPPSVGNQLLAALFIWITSFWQIPFCILLAQKTGPLLMIVIHLVFSQIFGALDLPEGLVFSGSLRNHPKSDVSDPEHSAKRTSGRTGTDDLYAGAYERVGSSVGRGVCPFVVCSILVFQQKMV